MSEPAGRVSHHYGPLAGRTVVVTRPEVGTLAVRLADRGAVVDHVPLIAIGPPADGGVAVDAALAELASFDWLVVTSVNGAARVGTAAAAHPHVHLAAVGAATAAALSSRAGRPVDLVPLEANSEGLLAAFPRGPSRVLLAQADRAGDHLAGGLRAAGHEVVAVEAYATISVPPDDHQLRVLDASDAVVLASGSAVEAWERSLRAASRDFADVGAAIVTIGRRTAEVAESCGLAVAAVASSPTDEGIVAAVASALQARD
jgi:uroporphyrinogen-III synthase